MTTSMHPSIDGVALRQAVQTRDADALAGLYADDATVEIIDARQPAELAAGPARRRRDRRAPARHLRPRHAPRGRRRRALVRRARLHRALHLPRRRAGSCCSSLAEVSDGLHHPRGDPPGLGRLTEVRSARCLPPPRPGPRWSATTARSRRSISATCSPPIRPEASASSRGGGITLDYSKNRVTRRDARAPARLAPRPQGCASGSTRCSRGEHINVTEDRAVGHVALRDAARRGVRRRRRERRARPSTSVLDRMSAFADASRSGEWVGPHRQAASARSSTSASAARTSGPRWRTSPAARRAGAISTCASSPTSTGRRSPRRSATWTPPRRCSSSSRRRSPRSRR